MAIDKKLIHFKTKENFMSANGVNGNPNTPTSGSEETGNAEYGQIKGTSIVFIKDSQEIWTHGQLYSCSDPNLSNFVTKEELEELEKLSAPMISVTYNELKTLRDNSQLIPGQQYRITDYVTTTAQAETQSAGHQFDVIVTADNENTLNEVARACRSEFDIEKYKDAYSSTLGDKMLYIGTQEYEGKEYHLYEAETLNDQMLVDFNHSLETYPGTENFYQFEYFPSYIRSFDGSDWGVWECGKDCGERIAFKYEEPNYFDSCKLDAWQIWYSLDNDAERFAWADADNGKGVIYRMIDEWNNDCPYDFKNIQFKRGVYDGGGIAPVGDEDKNFNLFTFSFRTENNEIIDTSIFGNNGRLLNDGGQITGVCGNVIGQYMTYDGSIENPTKTTQRLNDIVFYSHYDYDSGLFYGYHSNSFGDNCFSNSLGNNCDHNTFGVDCDFNSFGDNCWNNTFGNNCCFNSFDNDCCDNTFSECCYENTFGERCGRNSFGNYCSGNSFDHYFSGNSFGNGCSDNTFDSDCYNNSLGNNCDHNTFGNENCYNSFGNNCYHNTFGADCSYNSFDNNCNNNSFGIECYSNSFGNECYYNILGNYCYSNSFGNECCNNSFGHHCNCNSFGNNCYNNSFGNYCYSNSFGNGCKCNSFRLGLSNLLLKYCHRNHFDDGCSYNVIWNSSTTGSNIPLQNININRGVSGTDSNYNYINVATLNSEKEININNYNGHIYIDYGDVFKVTYSELVDLRDNSQLIAGRQYRITDYVTSTSQKDTKSAEHQFDIIVTAINEYTLSEEAQAIQNINDGYFDDSNLSAWKIWYSLDNDTSRFAWAGDERIESEEVEVLDTSNCTISVGYSYDEEEDLNKFDERVHFISQMWDDPTNEPYFEGNDINELISHWGYETDPDGVKNCLTLYGLNLEFDEETGEITSEDGISDDRWYYRGIVTVDGTDYDYWESAANGYYLDQIEDIDRKMYFLTDRIVSGEPTIITNTIETVIPLEPKGVIYRMIDEFGNDLPHDFKNIMLKCPIGEYKNEYPDYYYTFTNVDKDNRVHDVSLNIGIFNLHVVNNVFNHVDTGDVLSNLCLNLFIAKIYSPQYKIGFANNSFGSNCSNNIFGEYCCDNSFGNECYRNSFGSNCYKNSFGNDCRGNSFGNGCNNNSFGNSCSSNYFGNSCSFNYFGNSCWGNSFRVSADIASSLKGYIRGNHFDDDCCYNVIWNSDTTSNNVQLKNINVNRGVSGTNSNYNFINIDTLNADYEIQVAKNSKGEIKIYCEADLIA